MHTQPGLQKLYYIGPMFRRERPQKGRFRQFYQIGAEVLGPSDAPSIDAEIIELVLVFIEKCGLQGCALYVNSIGCSQCRAKYVELLRRELTAVKDRLGPDSQRRLETNPLRVLDSKVEDEQPIIEELPSILDHLCSACREHFQKVQQELKDRGLTYQINRRLVRGLDYYTRTTFEITAPGLGAQNAICGGGRYDGLAELLGGPPTKGTGWALGTDRLLLALEQAAGAKPDLRLDVFVIWLGEKAYARARQLARRLRDAGVSVELVYEETKLKKALGWADRAGARYALILGEDELAQNQFTLREMQTGSQQVLTESQLLEVLVPRRRETVLILEEEEAVRKLAREAFQQGGYTVIEVKRKADLPDVTQQGKFKPDLVLLDVSMPAFAAQDVIDQLKQIGPDVGIIMLTGPGMTQAAIERLKQGLRTEVVEKPFTPGALTHVASRLLQTRRG
ncbi:MAG: histidine--tRNA ligase, partial [Acidobacteria bacterium]|nr:histidine--tRNA ligase [Acidobacteriota bacterium]